MKTILVVDDSNLFRDIVVPCLQTNGYEVATAGHGGEALAVLRTRSIDLILLDLDMPVMDGVGLLEAMKKEVGLQRPPVLLLTGLSGREQVLRVARFGLKDYLLKSRITLKELLARIAERLASPVASAKSPVPITAPLASSSNTITPVPATATTATSSGAADQIESGSTSRAAPKGAAGAKRASPSMPATPADASAKSIATTPSVDVDRATLKSHQSQVLAEASGEYNLRPGEIKRLLTGDKCLLRVQKAMSAMRLSGAATKVIAAATSPNADVCDVLPAIDRDRALATRVLAVLSESRTPPGTAVQAFKLASDAADHFDTADVRDTALACAIFDAMPPLNVSPGSVGWTNAICTGLVARQLMPTNEASQGAAAFLTGLCKGLGDILFRTFFAEEHALVVQAMQQSDRERDEIERIMLGMTGAQLTDMVLQDFGVPGNIRRAVTAGASGEASRRSQANEPVERVLNLAIAFANAIAPDPTGCAVVRLFSKAVVRAAMGRENAPDLNGAALQSQAERLTAALAGEALAVDTTATQGDRPLICVAREPSLSTFDPVVSWLQTRLNVELKDHIPQNAAELGRCVGLAVLARSASSPGFGAKAIAAAKKFERCRNVLWVVERAEGGGVVDPRDRTALVPLAGSFRIAPLHAFADRISEQGATTTAQAA